MKSRHFENTVAGNQSAPSSPTSSGDPCLSSNTTQTVTMPIGGCNHSSWTCTFASKSPSLLTLDLSDGNVKLVNTTGGPVSVSYTIRKSLELLRSGYYKDFSYSVSVPASSNASANVQLTTHSGAGNSWRLHHGTIV